MRNLIFLFALLLTVISCRKDKELKTENMIGNYFCEARSSSNDILGLETDTTFMTSISVTCNGNSIEVLNAIVPIDSLKVDEF